MTQSRALSLPALVPLCLAALCAGCDGAPAAGARAQGALGPILGASVEVRTGPPGSPPQVASYSVQSALDQVSLYLAQGEDGAPAAVASVLSAPGSYALQYAACDPFISASAQLTTSAWEDGTVDVVGALSSALGPASLHVQVLPDGSMRWLGAAGEVVEVTELVAGPGVDGAGLGAMRAAMLGGAIFRGTESTEGGGTFGLVAYQQAIGPVGVGVAGGATAGVIIKNNLQDATGALDPSVAVCKQHSGTFSSWNYDCCRYCFRNGYAGFNSNSNPFTGFCQCRRSNGTMVDVSNPRQ